MNKLNQLVGQLASELDDGLIIELTSALGNELAGDITSQLS